MLNDKPVRVFLFLSGVLLSVTGISKLISSAGSARILQYHEPILSIEYRYVFLVVGTLEILTALFCFFGRQQYLKIFVVAWLATNFMLYRLGLILVGYHKPCSCLGTLTSTLHISPDTANKIMEVILFFLLIGSYYILIWLWRHKRTSHICARQ
jgi:hypothetical protein